MRTAISRVNGRTTVSFVRTGRGGAGGAGGSGG